ncbi:hypothetical protein [Paenibacillus sp. SYP-B4298]|uniref:hypothetical protein n=1 Tax=Paenibacillus sp. SYP-B4298 TaxID=2996034 RepID=UPI0022DE0BB4|nr:hypothetical protein [Paenibacillus sp. SYP-B4298]
MKKVTMLLFSAILMLTFSSNAFAVTGEGAARVVTTGKYTGIQAYLTIPSDVFVSNDGSYIAFYLGLGDTCEGGISYKPSTGWNKFLNCGKSSSAYNRTDPLTNQPSAGSQIHLKLINNLNNTATLYINGTAAYTLPTQNSLTSSTTVKMVHSTHDNQDKNKYSYASFSQVLVQSTSGGSYTNFPTNLTVNYPWGKGDYVLHSTVPLSTSLKANK